MGPARAWLPVTATCECRVNPTDYQPVDCGLHSAYELLVLQHRSCTLDWYDAAGTLHSLVVTPTDLYTRNGEEFMAVTDNRGAAHAIRLDRIRRCEPA